MPTQQGCRLDEEAPESSVWEQPRQPGQHRPVCGIECWSMHLASEDYHLVAQHHDLDCEICTSAANESDELELTGSP
ncbi:MAG: hypothetical protein M0Z46_02255 [Actinomycetota bacterium]|nr:hypothetical protein [Actinomycetota bacterium]